MRRYFITFLTVLFCDVVSKLVIQAHFPGEFVVNKGISWSLFHSTNPAVAGFVAGCVGAFVALFGWYTFVQIKHQEHAFGEVVVLAGASANLLDRLIYGGVVDFIVIGCCGYTWPLFNLADFAIVTGVAIMVLRLPLYRRYRDY